MTYINPSIRIIKDYQIDERWRKWTGTTWRHYTDVDEANRSIPVNRRHRGLFAFLIDGLYWYKDGVDNIDLVPFHTDSANGVEFLTKGVSWDGTYVIAAGTLFEKIVIVPSADASPYASTAGSTGDIVPVDEDNVITPEVGTLWTLDIFAKSERAIVVEGIPTGTKVYFIKRKIIASTVVPFIESAGDVDIVVLAGEVLEKLIVVPSEEAYPYLVETGTSTEVIPADSEDAEINGVVWSLNAFSATTSILYTIKDLPDNSQVYLIKRKIF